MTEGNYVFLLFKNSFLHGVSLASLFSLRFGCPERPLRALGEAFVCLSARREGVLGMSGHKEACQGQVGLICRAQRANVGVQLEIKMIIVGEFLGIICLMLVWRSFRYL